MKLASFLLLIIGWLGLMNGRVDAATSGPASPQASQKSGAKTVRGDSTGLSHGSPAGSEQDRKNEKKAQSTDNLRALHDVLKKGLGHSPANPPQANRLAHPNYQQRPGSATAIGFRQPGSNRSGGVEGKRLIQYETAQIALPVHPPSVVRPSAVTLNNLRHRSPNPPAIGGLGNSTAGNTGSIDGSRVRRRR